MTGDLKEVLYSIVPQATFDCGRFGVLQWDAYRIAYHNSTGIDSYIVSSVKPNVPDELLAELTDVLRTLLRDYTVDGRFGNKLAHVFGGTPEIEVAEFALDAVRAASVLGPDQMAGWIGNWASGKPVRFRLCAVLSGLTVDDPLEMEGGIRFRNLPTDLSDVYAHLPPGLALPGGGTLHFGLSQMMGALRVEVDCETGPSICNPGKIEIPPDRTWNYGPMSVGPIDALCESLSLVCNGYVSSIVEWSDCGEEIRALSLNLGSGYSFRREDAFSSRAMKIAPGELTEVHEIIGKRIAGIRQKKGLDRAISRWMRSKRWIGHTDQFIELRIALEALYLQGKRDELGFRLANYGAWHLGANFAERNEYREVLRNAYGIASNAVHAAEVADTEANRKLLASAQDLCRKGILKRLDEGEAPDWDELILGGGP